MTTIQEAEEKRKGGSEKLRSHPRQMKYDKLALVAVLVVAVLVVLIVLVVLVVAVLIVVLVVAVLVVVSHDGASFRTFCLQGLFLTADEKNIRA